MSSPKTLIIIPTYNEAGNIRILLNSILSSTKSVDVLVVDDASPDGTAEIVDEIRKSSETMSIFLLRRSSKKGLGKAYINAYHWALSQNYQFIGQMDADGSHRVEDLLTLLESIGSDSNIDLIVGSRWIPGGAIEGWSYCRNILSRIANIYSKVVLQSGLNDMTSGFRIYRRQILQTIDFEKIASQGYSFQIEMALEVKLVGGNVLEIPITFVERTDGQSKMTFAIVFEAMKLVTMWGLRKYKK